VSTAGTEGDGSSHTGLPQSVSAHGRFVAFESGASNLVPGDTNGVEDVFVRDRRSHTTSRVSVSSIAEQANGESFQPTISADGRLVAFTSLASDLVGGDTNGFGDVFVRDLRTHITRRVSVSTTGDQGDGDSWEPSISADGRLVAFTSWASDLVGGDTNGFGDVFVRNLRTQTTRRVSVSSAFVQGNDVSKGPSMSADGRFVAFTSEAANLVPGDTNIASDVFVRDRRNRTTTRVSVSATGAQADYYSNEPAISGDGRFIAFASKASNLVSQPTGGYHVFVRDRRNHSTALVSVGLTGTPGDQDSLGPSISADGRYVAFYSFASNLVGADKNTSYDVFVRDLLTHATSLASMDNGGAQGNADSGSASLSADGRYVAFSSYASNLVRGDTNDAYDVFLRGPLF
jgi:Tol biopolymer transport system component